MLFVNVREAERDALAVLFDAVDRDSRKHWAIAFTKASDPGGPRCVAEDRQRVPVDCEWASMASRATMRIVKILRISRILKKPSERLFMQMGQWCSLFHVDYTEIIKDGAMVFIVSC